MAAAGLKNWFDLDACGILCIYIYTYISTRIYTYNRRYIRGTSLLIRSLRDVIMMLRDGERGMGNCVDSALCAGPKTRPGPADNGVRAACAPWTLRTGPSDDAGRKDERVGNVRKISWRTTYEDCFYLWKWVRLRVGYTSLQARRTRGEGVALRNRVYPGRW